jgi:predicted nucleotide-binding protein
MAPFVDKDKRYGLVFVVHGHDEEMKQAVARTLSQLGLQPIILHEQPNQGKTPIEKFERSADVQFAVILLSPADMGYMKTASSEHARARPRQNVILELGYFVGKLTRERAFALKRGGDLESPNDIAGLVYTPYDAAGHGASNWCGS